MVSPMVMSSMPARQTMSPARGLLDVHALQSVEGEQLGDARLLRSGRPACRWRSASPTCDLAVEDAADGDAAQVVAGVEVGDEHLQRAAGIAARRRDVSEDGVEQRAEVVADDLDRGAWRDPRVALV